MANVYERLGVPTIVNAYGANTRIGGGLMAQEVVAAMAEATQFAVDVMVLQGRASEIIADVTGAEAGIVTSGASAGLMLATAATMTGLDPAAMDRLPDTTGLRNEVIIVRSQRNSYDHAIRAAGARLVEIGIPDRFSGPGVRDAETWEIAAAINARTAAVFHLAKPHSRPTIEEVVAVARRARVPVIVDAAAELPPVAHLKRFIAAGADLVAFSGGKAMGGPQGSGVLAGRRALVAAAYLQQADLDYLPHMWRPPASLFGGGKLAGLPHHGIGRACKVGKEQIVGVLVALRRFAEEPFAVRLRRWSRLTAECLEAARGLPGIAARLIEDPRRTGVPMVELAVDARAAGMTATELLRRLATGRPRIEANPTRVGDGAIILGPVCLKDGEPAIIGRRLREILSARGAAGAPRGRATRSRRP